MDTRDRSAGSSRDEWSVTLNGSYVVRFRGAHAQEYARRQLHELAELLGFDTPARDHAASAQTPETPEESTDKAPAD